MVFELLHQKIREILEKKNFLVPTLPQRFGIPEILKGKNVLIIAPTGSGKTEAAILPIFHFLLTKNYSPISVLYITPLRALNRDLLDRLIFWCNELDIEIAVRHGDTTVYERKKQAIYPPKILILTPETLQAILPGKKIREWLKNVKFVIIDEVHELADSKRGIQLSLALQRLKLLAKDFQVIMLSATVGSPEKVKKLFCENAKIINASFEKKFEIKVIYPSEKIVKEDVDLDASIQGRVFAIKQILENSKSCLIFTNTREFAETLVHRLKILFGNIPIEVHHSSLSKDVRIATEKAFKENKLKAIISTSSLQLGIDIGSVDVVVQYQSPRQVIQLIQRVGRAGHKIEKISKGYIIATDELDLLESAVIAKMALENRIENIKIFEKCWDVLSHQIIGFSLDVYKPSFDEIFNAFKKTFPYKTLEKNEFLKLLNFLYQLNLIFLNSYVKPRKKAYKYYFENISVIPDIKQYKVINVVNRKFVGNLDEEFVATQLEINKHFLMKGEAWKVVSVEEDKVYVEPSIPKEEIVVPVWEGELIPVSKEVALNVRDLINNLIKIDESLADNILENYPIDENGKKAIKEFIKKQKQFFDLENFVIENHQNLYIFHFHFGSLINEGIAKVIEAFIGSKLPKIFVKSFPYGIVLKLPTKNDEIIKRIFDEIEANHIEDYIKLSIYNSKLFEYKFIQVAKRFGIIAKDAELTKRQLRKLLETYRESFVGKETLNEIFTEKIDLENLKKIWNEIRKNYRIVEVRELSPLATLILKRVYYEEFVEKFLEPQIFEKFKKRIFNTSLYLICLNCGNYLGKTTPNIFTLPKCICGSRLIAVVKSLPDLEKAKTIIKKKVKNLLLTKQEKKFYERLFLSSQILLNYGKKGIIALAGKGIGVSTALKILNKMYHNEEEFLKEIFEKEKEFIRIRRFLE